MGTKYLCDLTKEGTVRDKMKKLKKKTKQECKCHCHQPTHVRTIFCNCKCGHKGIDWNGEPLLQNQEKALRESKKGQTKRIAYQQGYREGLNDGVKQAHKVMSIKIPKDIRIAKLEGMGEEGK